MANVDVAGIAKELNVTVRMVGKLTDQGMPKAARNCYDVEKCLKFYVRFLQKALKSRPVPLAGGKRKSLVDARERKVQADAELVELELGERRRELLPADMVERRWSDIVTTTRSQLLSVASRVAPRIVGETDRAKIQQAVDGEIREALFALASHGRDGTSSASSPASTPS